MRKSVATGTRGMILPQVMVLAGVLLMVIFAGLKAVRSSIQIANSAAGAAAFQDLTSAIQQTLSSTDRCLTRVSGLTAGPALNALLLSSTATLPVTVRNSDGLVVAAPGNDVPEYTVNSIVLTHFRPLGRRNVDLGNPNWLGFSDSYIGEIVVSGNRRTEFLGSSALSASVPILIQINPVTKIPAACSTRSLYTVELGPPGGIRKSGIECFDRGGTPIYDAATFGAFWVCALPTTSLLSCASINNSLDSNGNPVHPEGWTCDTAHSTGGMAYAY